MRLSVVTYLYDGPGHYTAEHVNTLRRMVARNLAVPHDFWCIGDNPEGLDPEIRFLECDRSLLPLGGCYVRLELWKRDAGAVFGDRILLLDIDAVICGSLDHLVQRTEDVVLWRDPLNGRAKGWLYNGGMILMTPGARPEVWERFDPATSPQAVIESGMQIFDQGWLGLVLGPDEAVFTRAEGVLSYKFDAVRGRELPEHAAIVFFHGNPKPWQVDESWVRDHWH